LKTRIYIHRATERDIPEDVESYSTPLQVAYWELTDAETADFTEVLINKLRRSEEENKELLKYHFPYWKPCIDRPAFRQSVSDLYLDQRNAEATDRYYELLIAHVCGPDLFLN